MISPNIDASTGRQSSSAPKQNPHTKSKSKRTKNRSMTLKEEEKKEKAQSKPRREAGANERSHVVEPVQQASMHLCGKYEHE